MEPDRIMLEEQIRKLAAVYAPEWRFDEQSPDVATALALIWANMFEGTLSRYDRLAMKNKLAFFNTIDTRLRPSVPAEGYVTFGLTGSDMGGQEAPQGTAVLAGTDGEEQDIVFETMDDVYVTPVTLEELILTDGRQDTIQMLYLREGPEETRVFPFCLFHSDKENLQEHVFLLGAGDVLAVKPPAKVFLHMEMDGGIPGWFLDEDSVVMEYWAEQTSQGEKMPCCFVPFHSRRIEGESLALEIAEGQPVPARTERDGQEGYLIRCRLIGSRQEEKMAAAGERTWQDSCMAGEVSVSSEASDFLPDAVQTGEGEAALQDILVFGERPSPFGEFYVACDQALSKGGAAVRMEFTLDYAKIPADAPPVREHNWKLIMKRSDFLPDAEYDITIGQVVWEYYNGNGWGRLFADGRYSRVFSREDCRTGQQVRLEFVCPRDAAPYPAGPVQARCLRARILKMENLFKMNGSYIVPVINDLRFSYSYGKEKEPPLFLDTYNNRTWRKLSPVPPAETARRRSDVRRPLFAGVGGDERSLYMRFSGPFLRGPVKILFAMEENITGQLPRLEYEYYGKDGFRPLVPVDGTGQMHTSGILTFLGRVDFTRTTLWGCEGYWLRITDVDGGYRNRPDEAKSPRVSGIYMNAVRVRAVRTMPEEFFRIEPQEKNKVCRLLHGNVQNLEVWIDESGALTRKQMEGMEKEELSESGGRNRREFRQERDAEGKLTAFWVRWTERENFYFSGPADRHYTVDRNLGTVTFSDGIHGAIPPSGAGQTIRVSYTAGGGESGNLPAGNLNQMMRTVGFINQVTNPQITSGGSGQENLQEAVARRAARLRHGGRAVTASDYETLAMEASRSVLRVKCFSNYSEDGRPRPGSVTLVLLQKDFLAGGLYFERVKQEVLRYITPLLPAPMAAPGRFAVAEPVFFRLRCRIDIVVGDPNDVFEVRRQVLERIEEFLDPVKGNFNKKGWEIGQIPNEVQIANAVRNTPGLLFLRRLRMTAYRKCSRGWVEAEKDFVMKTLFGVALNGEHELTFEIS